MANLADMAPPQVASGTLVTGLIGTFLGHVWGYVPGFVAVTGGVLAIVWYGLMIWEAETVKSWRATRSARRKLRKIAYLKAEERIIVAELAELEPTAMVTAAERSAAVQIEADTPRVTVPPAPPKPAEPPADSAKDPK